MVVVVVRYLTFQLVRLFREKGCFVWQQRCGDVYRVGVALVSFCSVVGSTVAWVRWEEILHNCLHNYRTLSLSLLLTSRRVCVTCTACVTKDCNCSAVETAQRQNL